MAENKGAAVPMLPGAAVPSSGALPGAMLPGATLPGCLPALSSQQQATSSLERHEQELSRMEAEQQAKEEQELLGLSMMFSLAEQKHRGGEQVRHDAVAASAQAWGGRGAGRR